MTRNSNFLKKSDIFPFTIKFLKLISNDIKFTVYLKLLSTATLTFKI